MTTKPSAPRKKKAPAKKPAPALSTYRGNPNYSGPRRPAPKKKKVRGGGGGLLPPLWTLKGLFWRAVLIGTALVALMIAYFALTLPDVRAIDTIRKQQGITIEAADGHAIANYGDVYGEYIPYDQFPKTLIQAVIATEDRRFFVHHGIDVFGIMRAILTNVTRGHMVQGGSTVTQQVAKNVFLTPERSLSRKLQEVMLAFYLEGRFTKKEIMAIYLNRVYLGSGTFGVDAAARRYFNKGARDLDLDESALLAGLLKAPSRYSPASNTARSRERLHQVLLNMVDAGYLKQSQVQPALDNYAKAPSHQNEGGDVRYFSDWVLDEIPDLVGQVDEDLIVTTTLDSTLQSKAQEAVQTLVTTEGPAKNVSQGALVSMTPDGAVKAMVGGVSYGQSQYNRATQAKRQPGSSFKLFVYLAALEAGYNPQTVVTDAPITLQVGNKSWSPDNDDKNEYRGDIPLYEALRHSLNTVSVRLITTIGPARVASMAERLGIPNVPAYPSIALGAVEATVLEMTGAYAHLPNHGKKVEPYGILSIRTRAGVDLYKRTEPEPETLLANGTVEMMNYMLLDVVRHGTGIKASLGARPAAGKTGTSQDFKDAWFVGFTPQLVTGVWVGNDDNKSMKKIFGGEFPARIWHNFMTGALEGQPIQQIPNSPSSTDGLLPWLFGSSSQPPAGVDPTAVAPTPSAAPQDAPFGAASPPLNTPPAANNQQPSTSQSGDVLTPQFWNKLMDKATPPKGKVEYSYPGDHGYRH